MDLKTFVHFVLLQWRMQPGRGGPELQLVSTQRDSEFLGGKALFSLVGRQSDGGRQDVMCRGLLGHVKTVLRRFKTWTMLFSNIPNFFKNHFNVAFLDQSLSWFPATTTFD